MGNETDSSPRSQAGLAYETIRNAILRGQYEPSQKLKIQELARLLGVSPGAVREALSRLVPEQLVVSRDQRGFSVAPLSIADLQDLTDLRCEIEAIALRRSLARGTIEWESDILAAAHRLNATTPVAIDDHVRVADAWAQAHAEFHTVLVSACGSPRLLALYAQLYEQSERYRGMTARIKIDRDIIAEHQQLADLALARDTEQLIRCMSAHLRLTTDLIVSARQGSSRA